MSGYELHLDRAKSELPDLASMQVVSSDLQRCVRAAQYLMDGKAKVDSRLRELDFGHWENRSWDDIPRSESDPWAADYLFAAPPGGETFQELLARCQAFLSEWRLQERPVLAVTHAGWIRAALVVTGSAKAEKVFAQKIPFCSITRVTI
jgi:alpha-ribazole phosphatase